MTIQWYLDNKEWWENIISGEYQNYFEKMYVEKEELRNRMSKYCLDEVNFDSMTASSKARQDVTDILKILDTRVLILTAIILMVL